MPGQSVAVDEGANDLRPPFEFDGGLPANVVGSRNNGQMGITGDSATPDSGATRVLALIEFLRELDSLKHPPVRDIANYKMYRLDPPGLNDLTCVRLHSAEETWLEVSFVDLPKPPDVPPELQPWLDCGDTPSPSDEPLVAPPSEWTADESEDFSLQAQRWVETQWAKWSEEYLEAQRNKAFYRRMYEQMHMLQDNRESVELCWGFSMLRWTTQDHTISHPLFTVPVEVEIAADRTLSVTPTGALELETLYLSNLHLANRGNLTSQRELLEDDPFDPWDPAALAENAREVVRSLSLNGVLQGEAAPTPGAPVADVKWVLFLRRKRPDYQGFLDKMRDAYLDGARIPIPLLSAVIDEPMTLESRSGKSAKSSDRLLLPLPANAEQQSILELAQDHSGVVVQGPPGTGKSHTIANLIAHYVAYGQRVLVVAEKEQALQVLAEKIPPQIRDLSVSVLGADAEGRKKLESSINAIQTRVSQVQPADQERLITRLTADLDKLDSEIAVTTDKLLRARRSEVENLPGAWPCGNNPGPEVVAKWLAANTQYAGIPDRLSPEQKCPVSAGELAELHRLIVDIGTERAQQTAFVLPDPTRLPEAHQLQETFLKVDALKQQVEAFSVHVTNHDAFTSYGPDRMRQLADDLDEEAALRESLSEPWLVAYSAANDDELLARDWQEFFSATREDRELVFSLRPGLASHDVQVPKNATPEFTAHLNKAHDRLAAKGKLGLFQGDIKEALGACTVDGRVPSTATDVELCLLRLRIEQVRDGLVRRWATHLTPVDGPTLATSVPEDEVGKLLTQVERVDHGPERWAALTERLGEAGIAAPKSVEPSTLRRTAEVVRGLLPQYEVLTLQESIESLSEYLADGSGQERASGTWTALSAALSSRNVQTWGEVRATVLDLQTVAPQATKLLLLAERLASVAPVWTQRILTDPNLAAKSEELRQMWAWQQLQTWLEEIWTTGSPSQYQRQLEKLAVSRRRVVSELVGARAWGRLQRTIKDPQRQALNAYKAAMKAHGKTGGKYKARWLAQIREALNRSKDAVPVWVMPASRAMASFRPEKEPPFDVLIVDEASQLGIDAIPLLSLAKRAIVVGDDKQTSPAGAVGVNQEEVHRLIDSHLRDVPNSKVLFNAGDSLYDLAVQKFPSPVMLIEHFRSLPEIIGFSNRHVYNDKIEPLRDQRPTPTWPALGAVKVKDGYRVGKDTNPNEAHVVTELVQEMVSDPLYDGKTIGVVSLLSTSGQAQLLRDQLFDQLGPNVVEERRLRVGDAAQFQGDERDIVVVSLVVGTDPGNPTAQVAAMTDKTGQQRINVAASRAKDQMWVVHSVDPERFAQGDLRAALIRHCRDPHSLDEMLEDQIAKCDSEFEIEVLRRIAARGYARIRAQVRVGAESNQYRIDLVVDGPTSRLAVECDGERWHGPERWHADRARQEVLERAGWTFERIRGSAFFRDPDKALEPLWARLGELGIPTGEEWLREAQPNIVSEREGLASAPAKPESASLPNLNDYDDELEAILPNSLAANQPTVLAAPDSPPTDSLLSVAELTTSPADPSASTPPMAGKPSKAPTPSPSATGSREPTGAERRSEAPTLFPSRRPPKRDSERQSAPRIPRANLGSQSSPRGGTSDDAGSRSSRATERGSASPSRPEPKNETHSAKSEANRALAAELRKLGKPANGDTWKRAKQLVKDGKSMFEAAQEA